MRQIALFKRQGRPYGILLLAATCAWCVARDAAASVTSFNFSISPGTTTVAAGSSGDAFNVTLTNTSRRSRHARRLRLRADDPRLLDHVHLGDDEHVTRLYFCRYVGFRAGDQLQLTRAGAGCLGRLVDWGLGGRRGHGRAWAYTVQRFCFRSNDRGTGDVYGLSHHEFVGHVR